jgi:hypothetical protein
MLGLLDMEYGFVTRAADRPSMWMAGSTTSLLLLHFYTRGVVHRRHGWETFTLKIFVFAPSLLSFSLPSYFFLFSTMSYC